MTADEFYTARKRLGLTQKQLAEALQCDVRTIRRWERGERAISGPSQTAMHLHA